MLFHFHSNLGFPVASCHDSLLYLNNVSFVESTHRHQIEIDNEYIIIELMDTAGEVMIYTNRHVTVNRGKTSAQPDNVIANYEQNMTTTVTAQRDNNSNITT
jgi:hypothetical protein